MVDYLEYNGTWYARGTIAFVIPILEYVRETGQRIRLHYGYTSQGQADAMGGTVGLDWMEEHDVEGTVGRSVGPIKVPLLIPNKRAFGGGAILTDCIVKITTTGFDRVTLYQHPDYSAPKLALKFVGLGCEIEVNGLTHARFKSLRQTRKWVARMGLKVSD